MTSRSLSQNPAFSSTFSCAALAALALIFAACSKPANETATATKAEAPGAAAASPAAPAAPGDKAAPTGPVLDSVDQKVSYGVGYSVGATVAKQTDLTVDREALQAGMEDGLAGTKPRASDGDIQAAFSTVQQRATARQLATTQAFFEKNRTKPGVTVTASGLQYEVIKKGPGLAKPKATDTVTVHYQGTLLDGTVFDSSIQRGTPTQFTVNAVIRGWTEALQLMSIGDKWRLFIPAPLAYGPRGNGKIPPNAALIFEVELLGIK